MRFALPPLKRTIAWTLIAVLVALLAIQAVPYGRNHTNPPVLAEPAWDSARTREMAKGACFDCHSNETVWPWYSSIAPLSWISVDHVEEGRDELNFSEWEGGENGEIAESVIEGSMPPFDYSLLHPAARLSDAETDELVEGLRQTFGAGESDDHE